MALEPDADGQHWKAGAASTEMPWAGSFIRGVYSPQSRQSPLQFGIDAYCVQEGEGKDLERLRNTRQLSAEIALAPWGQAKLGRLVEE